MVTLFPGLVLPFRGLQEPVKGQPSLTAPNNQFPETLKHPCNNNTSDKMQMIHGEEGVAPATGPVSLPGLSQTTPMQPPPNFQLPLNHPMHPDNLKDPSHPLHHKYQGPPQVNVCICIMGGWMDANQTNKNQTNQTNQSNQTTN